MVHGLPPSTMDSTECCICLENLAVELPGMGRQVLPCGHVMHERCIIEMRRFSNSAKCPLCRQTHHDLTPVEDLALQATTSYARKEYQACFRTASDVLELEPLHGIANRLVGELYLRGLGVATDIACGKAHFEAALRGGDRRAVTYLGVAWAALGDLTKAIEFFSEGSLMGDKVATLNLGNCYRDLGDTEKAEDAYNLARKRGSTRASLALGMLFLQRGDSQKAQSIWEEGHLLGDADATCSLAKLNADLGNVERACHLYEEACQSGQPEAFVNYGILCEQLGDVQRAEQLYTTALRRGNGLGAFKLGRLHEERGELTKAKELHSLGHDLGSEYASYNLATLYYEQGDTAKALELFHEAHRRGHPGAAETLRSIFPRAASSALDEEIAALFGRFPLGSRIVIHGLQSEAGKFLNQLLGEVVKHDYKTGRCGVKIDGRADVKAIKVQHLKLATCKTLVDPRLKHDGEIVLGDDASVSTQVAIESSSRDANAVDLAAQRQADANAQVSHALLSGRFMYTNARMVLLKFSRRPLAFREALLQSPELIAYRKALEEQGFAAELASGAKVFVSPDHYEATIEAIRISGWQLFPDHVIVDPSLVDIVEGLVRSLPRGQRVYSRGSTVVPLGFAQAAMEMDADVSICKTFVDIRIPSSLFSSSTGPRTVSTTEADVRKGGNVRSSASSRGL